MARRLAAALLLLLSQTGDARRGAKKGSGVVRQPVAGDGGLPRGYTGPQSTQSSRSRGVDVTAAPRSSGIPLANTQGQNPDDPVVMWERAKALLESCPVSRAIGEPCDTAEDSAGVWLVLTELLEPSHFDVGFNYALALERFDQYYDAVLVWESVIRANPSSRERAVSECSKVISLIAREMGVPGAGSEHPDPEIEKRRRRERAQQGVTPDIEVQSPERPDPDRSPGTQQAEEILRVQYSTQVDSYLHFNYAAVKDSFETDKTWDPSEQLGFMKLYDSLKTTLNPSQVSQAMRQVASRHFGSKKSAETVRHDLEDRQIVRGILELLKKMGRAPGDIAEYHAIDR